MNKEKRINEEKMMTQILLGNERYLQEQLVNGYRKVIMLNRMFGDNQDDGLEAVIWFIEHALPAFSYEKVRDEVGDLTQHYHDLHDKACSDMRDTKFFKLMMEK